MLAWCGNCLQYSFFECSKSSQAKKVDDFKKIDIRFSDPTEIIRVLDTAHPNIYQIIAIEHEINVFIVLTWDFLNNIEVHQYQTEMSMDIVDFQIKVVKGMNHKLNYFMGTEYITDLADNIPYIKFP